LIVIGTLGAFAFLSLLPPRQTWYTKLGGATLVVYLFHGFVVKSLLYAGITFGGHENLGLLVLTPFAVLLATFLSWPSVTRLLNKAG